MAPAKRGTKRAAAAEAEAAPAKRLQDTLKRSGVSKNMYSAIVEALEHPLADGLNADCRRMLVAMLPQGLLVPVDQRHEVQAQTVKMVQEVFEDVQAKMQAEIDAEAAKLAEVEDSKSELESRASETEAALASATEVMEAKTASLAEASKAMLAAKAELAEKEQEQTAGDADVKKTQADKDGIDAALSEDFRKLRDGDVEAGQAKAHYEVLAALAAKLGMDESLLTALPTCMMKRPEERGSFDAMVVAQLGETLSAKAAELAAALQAAAPAREQRAAAVAAAQQALASAREVQEAGAAELSAAQGAQKEAEAALAAAKAALLEFEPRLAQALQAREEKSAQFENFCNYNLECFTELRDRLSPAAKAAQKEKEASMAVEEPAAAAPEAVAA